MKKVTQYVGWIVLVGNIALAAAAFTFRDEISNTLFVVMISLAFASGCFITERLVAAQNDDEWVGANKVEAGADDETE